MAKNWTMTFGVIFVLVGLLGYLHLGLGIVGPDGFFKTDGIHDTVHFLSGLVLLIVAFAAPQSSAMALKVFGIVYLLVGVLGFVNPDSILGIIGSNGNDTYLHLVLGVVITWAGFGSKDSMSSPMMTS